MAKRVPVLYFPQSIWIYVSRILLCILFWNCNLVMLMYNDMFTRLDPSVQ